MKIKNLSCKTYITVDYLEYISLVHILISGGGESLIIRNR